MEFWMALGAISLAVNGVLAGLWFARGKRISSLESESIAHGDSLRRLSESLERTRADLHCLLDSPLVGVFRWNAGLPSTDGVNAAGSNVDNTLGAGMANRAFLAMTGHPRDISGESGRGALFACEPGGSVFGPLQVEELRAKGRCGPFETEYARPDGTRVSLLAAAAMPDGPSGCGVVLAVDITVFLETRRELHRSEMRYRALAENSPAGIWQIRPDGRTVYLNPAMSAVLELDSPEELMASDASFEEFFDPEGLEAIRKEWKKRAMGVGSSYEVEVVGRWGRRTRMIIYGAPVLSQDGKLDSVMGTFLDITDRKREEEALRRSEERMRVAAECGNDLVYEWDLAAGSLDWFGPVEKRLGFAPGEIPHTREGWERLIHPEDLDEVAAAVEKHLAGRGPFFREYRIRCKDGSYRRWSDRGTAIAGADGSPCKWIGTTSDVTEARRGEEALRAKEEQLRQSQKLEAVGRLAGGIAHDFNNLLAAIMGYCELMLFRLEPDHPCRKEVGEILGGSDRAAGLIRQLLAFSRQEIPQPKVIDPKALLGSMERILRHAVEENIVIEIGPGGEAGRVRMDPAQFEQIVMNLVLNARDAMTEGGNLRIGAGTARLSGEMPGTFGRVHPGHHFRLSVSDTGRGIDPENLPHIFDPFFTTKEKGKGSGLGLSTVYGIVTQNLGCVQVESEAGKGSVFSVYLPITEDEEEEEAEVMKAIRESSIMARTVLVVEDDDEVRGIIRDLLGHQGFAVLEARRGREALALAEQSSQPVHLLLTDVLMPEMGGMELAESLRKVLPAVRVLYMSGHPEDTVLSGEVRNGGRAFIQKPFSMTALAGKIREVLG